MTLIDVDDDEGVRYITLDRPEKRNAFNDDMIRELGEALSDVETVPGIRCAVIRGAGRMFSAGVDTANLGQETPQNVRRIRRRMMHVWNLPEELTVPVVCQIHGAAVGGALELALACDFRVMASDAVAGLPEVAIGLVPDLGGTSRLPALVGLGRAKDLVMTRRMITGEDAVRIGLAERTGAVEDLDAITRELVTDLMGGSPVALGLAKRILDVSARPSLSTSLEMEAAAQSRCTGTDDFAEGLRALGDKRAPTFTGR